MFGREWLQQLTGQHFQDFLTTLVFGREWLQQQVAHDGTTFSKNLHRYGSEAVADCPSPSLSVFGNLSHMPLVVPTRVPPTVWYSEHAIWLISGPFLPIFCDTPYLCTHYT